MYSSVLDVASLLATVLFGIPLVLTAGSIALLVGGPAIDFFLAMLRNYEQADYSTEVHIAARALMTAAKEADEAATKRERERCISVVRGISDRHTLAASSCHLDGEKDAAALASYCARSIDDVAAILKGEA